MALNVKKDAVVYQIYPLSYMDSNNDGMGDIRGIISRNDAARSVRVVNTEDDTVLDVYVTLCKGARIQETALALQQNIKMAVQSMTGKPVTRINVHVDGIVADENKA